MAANVQMFLYLFKSKYRRKYYLLGDWVTLILILSYLIEFVCCNTCSGVQCVHGKCENGSCVCDYGSQGSQCQFCGGKIRLFHPEGYVSDGAGNYSINVKCTWLIDSGSMNSSIRLHFEEFATECSWDHLYIYDGDSIYAPLLAVYSGMVLQNYYSIRKVPEVVANSGSMLLHFYSDVAYNMTGFNISYRINSCPSQRSDKDCSGNGVCIDGVCTCSAGFHEKACDVPICPGDCKGNGICNMEKHKCECLGGYEGKDCSQVVDLGYWNAVPFVNYVPPGRSSHAALVRGDALWVVSGESFGRAQMVVTYDFSGNRWETVHPSGRLKPYGRYGHTTVLYGDKIYMYGGVKENGVITRDLWAFDITEQSWEKLTVKRGECNSQLCDPIQSAGHTADVVLNKMIVIFGHSPLYGYLNTVQEFHFGTREWSIVKTKGFPVKGGYGHSSAWDPLTREIYVYGGYLSQSSSAAVLSDKLYAYDPASRIWTLLTPSRSYRYLHTAAVTKGLMITFGGNTHNDTAYSQGAKCFSADFLAYDIACDTWHTLQIPEGINADLARFGHSVVMYDGSMYIYGGFNGQMLSDLLKYTPGNCGSLTTNETCLSTRPGVKCVWNLNSRKCEEIISVAKDGFDQCPLETHLHVNYSALCSDFATCASCVQTSYDCVWCGRMCSYMKCKGLPKGVTTLDHCEVEDYSSCQLLHSCNACNTEQHCQWDNENHCQPDRLSSGNLTDKQLTEAKCKVSCSERTSCHNCTQDMCMWCMNEERCVDRNAYVASFPYGQCMEWTTHDSKCKDVPPGSSPCNVYSTCESCQEDPACGWCDDGSGTGLGQCLEGGSKSPLHRNSSGVFHLSTCSKNGWFFTSCPTCQCNGHSTCTNSTNLCIQPCADLTEGPHCEYCVAGYYGNPVNGGSCSSCECNNQGILCNRESGKCFCTTKGIIGDHCERCDTQNHYFGDPTGGGSCFYALTIDYQFTFNLSKKEDRHFTQINFKNTPTKADVDADFQITCSILAKMNISVKTGELPENFLLSNHNCTANFKSQFSKSQYSFGSEDNTTFFVYVYDFQPPLWIQISFSQHPKMDLLQFFITFSTCFLALLLVAAVLWKIKQKYDLYRRRQRLFVEMEQMASRPFAQVLVELDRKETVEPPDPPDTGTTVRKRKKDCPSPIALEPCFGNRAAVLSLLVRLPTGGEPFISPGQTGIAVASALVTLGNPRKLSLDPAGKTEGKGKTRKPVSNQHPDTCI